MKTKDIIDFTKSMAYAVLVLAFSIWVFLSFFLFAGSMDNPLAEAAMGILLGFGQLYLVFLPNMAFWAYGNPNSISLKLWTAVTNRFPYMHRFDYRA